MEFFIIRVNKFDGIVLIYIMIQSYWQWVPQKQQLTSVGLKAWQGTKGGNTTSDEVYTSGSHWLQMNFIQVLNAVLMFKVVCLSSYFRASKIIEKQLQLTLNSS